MSRKRERYDCRQAWDGTRRLNGLTELKACLLAALRVQRLVLFVTAAV